MPKEPSVSAAIGFRVKCGRAVAVLLTGTPDVPRVLDRRTTDLCDPDDPESRQPYHESVGTARLDTASIARLTRVVRQCACRSIASLIREYTGKGYAVRGAGLVVGSEVNPNLIANPHVRAHAYEGRLFRDVTEDAVRRAGLESVVWIERTLYASAAKPLGRTEAQVKQTVSDLGRQVGRGWRVDEKAAATAAWNPPNGSSAWGLVPSAWRAAGCLVRRISLDRPSWQASRSAPGD